MKEKIEKEKQENSTVIIYDISTYGGRRLQIAKFMEEIVILKKELSYVGNNDKKSIELQRLKLQTIEQGLSALRIIQAEDRLKQNLWKMVFGVGGVVLGFVLKTVFI